MLNLAVRVWVQCLVQFGSDLEPEHCKGPRQGDGEASCVTRRGVLPHPLQQNLAGHRLVKLLACADLQGSVIWVEVNPIDVRTQGIGELGASEIIHHPRPKAAASVQFVAQAAEGIAQPPALV